MKTILAIALTAIATPALADPVATATTAAAPVAGTVSPDQRVCVVTPARTGSFIDRKVCRTRAEWAKRGVDLTATAK